IETAPEEVNRAGLPDEAGLEAFEDSVRLEHGPPEELCVPRVVRPVLLVLIEWDGMGHLHRRRRDGHIHTAAAEALQQDAIELRDRPRPEGHREGARFAVDDR